MGQVRVVGNLLNCNGRKKLQDAKCNKTLKWDENDGKNCSGRN
jgi:hypothetical protein